MPEFDPRAYPYPSRRNAVYARKAMACTSIPQGAQIGLDVMKAGGSAVDAAVAMAAAMPLLEPTSNGLGSDCFALVWMEKEKKLYGLNASGTAPAALSAERVRALGFSEMPKAGWIPTLVPGAPAGWAELNRRFGTNPLPELFAPAIRSAREGVPVAVNLEPMWAEDSQRIGRAMAENPAPHAYWWEKFTKNGEPYRAGDPVTAIHWKLSSKHDSLVVREPVKNGLPQAAVTVDLFGDGDRLDQVLGRLWTISVHLLGREVPHTILWLDRDQTQQQETVASQGQLLAAMAYLLSCPAPTQPPTVPLDLSHLGPAPRVHVTLGEEDAP